MNEPQNSQLTDLLIELGGRIGAEGSEADRRAQIGKRMADAELADDAVPAWLLDAFAAVRDEQVTDWVDFPGHTDLTEVMDFVRGLPQVLPVPLEDNVESLTIVFEPLGREATVSWEGSCYRVSEIGATWS